MRHRRRRLCCRPARTSAWRDRHGDLRRGESRARPVARRAYASCCNGAARRCNSAEHARSLGAHASAIATCAAAAVRADRMRTGAVDAHSAAEWRRDGLCVCAPKGIPVRWAHRTTALQPASGAPRCDLAHCAATWRTALQDAVADRVLTGRAGSGSWAQVMTELADSVDVVVDNVGGIGFPDILNCLRPGGK